MQLVTGAMSSCLEDEQALTFLAHKRLKKSPPAIAAASPEPTSVLYTRSPSPPTSSSLGGGGSSTTTSSSSAAATAELPPIDWDAVLAGDMVGPAAQDQSFLRWVMSGAAAGNLAGDGDDMGFTLEPISDTLGLLKAPAFDTQDASLAFSSPPPPLFQDPASQFAAAEPSVPFAAKPNLALPELAATASPSLPFPHHLNQQEVVNDLVEAARLIAEVGDAGGARGILARLNHRLPSGPSPLPLPPILRSAGQFKNALLLLSTAASDHPPPPPLDVLANLAAHKSFSDASPVSQFANFTSTQVLLDALGSARRVHVVDFDVGFGSQWPPLMQELAHRWRQSNGATPLLRVTALVAPGSRHPMELHLTHDNLAHFAACVGIPFEFNAIALDPSNPSPLVGLSIAGDESVAVHLPVGSGAFPPGPALLRIVRQLSPRIVFSVDHGGGDPGDFPFPRHLFHALQTCTALLESLDAAGMAPDASAKIERFIVQPRIDSLVLGRGRFNSERLPPWQAMFASAGFAPMQLSNAAEVQAECLLKRVPVQGFRVEKRQASLALWWHRTELVSVSAWRC